MHASTIFTTITLALAATVVASPTAATGAQTCSSGNVNKCCNGFKQQSLLGILPLIGLGCTNIIGKTCSSGNAACCTNSGDGVNINLLCQIPVLS